MFITEEKNYGADADGNRGRYALFAELDDSTEERESIASEIFMALSESGERIDIRNYEVYLYDSYFGIGCYFDIEPIDYMDEVLPYIIDFILEDVGEVISYVEEMDCILQLEEDLINAGYKGKSLEILSKLLNSVRDEWKVNKMNIEKLKEKAEG